MRILLLYTALILSIPASAQVKQVYIAAEMNETHLLDDGSSVEMWGYGIIKPSGAYQAEMPGPILEFNLGDTVEIHFHNKSPEDHTIHLHGLDVSMMEDGVPMTSMAVDPWDSIVYNFVANNPGSYLYHCHVLTTLHLMMGMYGVIIVHNSPQPNLLYSGGPSFQKEYTFLVSDMDKSVNANPLSPGPFHLFTMDYFMVNGLADNSLFTHPDYHVTAYPGDSILLHLASMGYSRSRFIFPEELNAVVYQSDGRVIPFPMDGDTLVVYPGERYEVLLTPTAITGTDIQVEHYDARNDLLLHTNYIAVNEDVGLAKPTSSEFEFYPNPTTGNFVLSTEATGSKMSLLSVTGEIVLEEWITSTHSSFDLSFLPAGIYFVRYNQNVQKLIKL